MDIGSILPTMSGSFFGAMIAFALSYVYRYHNHKKDKAKYKKMIKSEIELCIRVLGLDKVRLLPTERWTLAINLGALRLFDVEAELEPLNENYLQINYYSQTEAAHPAAELRGMQGAAFMLPEIE
jgi:hypothetical protein